MLALALAGAVVVVGIGAVGAAWWWRQRDEPWTPTRPRLERGPVADVPRGVVEDDFTYRWSRIPIGGGGWVTGLTIPPGGDGRMYARTDAGGAYRWDPQAERWTQMISTGSTTAFEGVADDYAVESLAVAPTDPDVVYLAVGDDDPPGEDQEPVGEGRILRSSDGGDTWEASAQRFFVGGNMDQRQRSERMAVDPTDPRRVLLGTRLEGLWRSTDGGVTWTRHAEDTIGTGRMPEDRVDQPAGVTFVTFGPGGDDARPQAFVGVAGDGVYRSDDGGDTFERIDAARDAADAPFEGSLIDGRLHVAWKQTDGDGPGRIRRYDLATGEWSDITPAEDKSEWSVAVDPTDPQRMVAADLAVTEYSLWRSTDGGESWDQPGLELRSPKIPWLEQRDVESWMSIGRLVLDPAEPGRLWFAEGLGVWRADDVFADGPVSFENESVGIEETVVAEVVAAPGGAPVSVIADLQGFWHDDVRTYPTAPLIDPTFAGGTDVDWSGGNPEVMVWAGAEYQRYWDEDRPGRGAISRDRGRTWTALPNLTRDHFGGNIAISATDPDNIVWVPSYYLNPWEYESDELRRGIFVTTDGGASWTELDGVDGSHRFHRLMWWFARQALASDKVEGGVFYLNDDEEHFWVSTDGGRTWDAAEHAPPCTESSACHVHGQLRASPARAGEVWASTGEAGLWRSRDRGATAWERIEGVDEVLSFDFGAPMAGSDRPTVFLLGRVQGDERTGIWRSTDDGATWTLIGRRPLGVFKNITNVNGDPTVPGKVYLSFGGVGAAYGEDPAA